MSETTQATKELKELRDTIKETRGELEDFSESAERSSRAVSGSVKKAKDYDEEIKKLKDHLEEVIGLPVPTAFAKFAHGASDVADMFGAIGRGAAVAFDATKALLESAIVGERHARVLALLGPAYDQVAAATNGAVTAEQALKAQQTLTQAGFQLSGEELAVVTRKAREYALATGTDTAQALEQLTDALRTNSTEGLGRFGLSAAHANSAAVTLHRATTQLAREQRGAAPAARTLGDESDNLARSFSDGMAALAAYTAEAIHLKEAMKAVAEVFALAADAKNIFENKETQQRHTTEAGQASQALNRNVRRTQRLYGEQGQTAALQSGRISQARQGAFSDELAAATSAEEVQAVVRRFDPSAQQAARTRELNNHRDNPSTSAAPPTFRAARGEGPVATGSGGGGGSHNDSYDPDEIMRRVLGFSKREFDMIQKTLEEFTQRAEHAREGLVAVTAQLLNGYRVEAGAVIKDTRSYETAIKDAQGAAMRTIQVEEEGIGIRRKAAQTQRELAAALKDGSTTEQQALSLASDLGAQIVELSGLTDDASRLKVANLQAERTAILATVAADEERLRVERENANFRTQFTKANASAWHLEESTAQGASSVYSSAISTMTGAFKSHLAAVLQGKETIAQALRGMLEETLLNIATESATQAVFELAKGIAAAARAASSYGADVGADTGAAMHFASAAMYAGIAGVAGAGAYAMYKADAATSASSSGSKPTSSGMVAGTPGSTADKSGGGAVYYTINVGGAPLATRQDIQDAVVEAHNLAAERGNRPRDIDRLYARTG